MSVHWIGVKGFWIEDNSYCEVVGVIDEGAGVYEFRLVDHDGSFPWVGYIEDFAPEC